MASSQKKGDYLTYRGTTIVPMHTDQDVWHHCEVAKDSFWAAVSQLNLGAAPSEGDEETYQRHF